MVTLSFPGIALGEPGNSELPPPPTANIVNQDQHFRLALVINRFDTGKLIPVIQRNGHFYIQSSELIGLGLPADKFSSPETDLTADTEIETHYDSEGQRLLLDIPTSWLPNQSIFTGTQTNKPKPLPVAVRYLTMTYTPAILRANPPFRQRGTNFVFSLLRQRSLAPAYCAKALAVTAAILMMVFVATTLR